MRVVLDIGITRYYIVHRGRCLIIERGEHWVTLTLTGDTKMNARDWNALGIEWIQEPVSKQAGDHATDRQVIGNAEMPIVKDLTKFIEGFGEGVVLGIMDGTSLRVMAQDVNRRLLPKGDRGEVIREAIYNRLRGVRNTGTRTPVTVTVKVYSLPPMSDGTPQTYKGTDLIEYQQAYLAALVDNGIEVAVAQQIAQMQTL